MSFDFPQALLPKPLQEALAEQTKKIQSSVNLIAIEELKQGHHAITQKATEILAQYKLREVTFSSEITYKLESEGNVSKLRIYVPYTGDYNVVTAFIGCSQILDPWVVVNVYGPHVELAYDVNIPDGKAIRQQVLALVSNWKASAVDLNNAITNQNDNYDTVVMTMLRMRASNTTPLELELKNLGFPEHK